MNADIKRFMAFVSPEPNTGCWLWTGGGKPYPVFWFNGRTVSGQVFAHDVLGGRYAPPGWHRDHICQVKCCVNPEHIEAVTPSTNEARKPKKGNQYMNATHCIHGHAFTPENTYISPGRGNRTCRTCQRNKGRKRSHSNAKQR